MANVEHLLQLQQGIHTWNEWIASRRRSGGEGIRHPGARVGTASFWADLRGADLAGRDLYQGKAGAGFSGIDLIGADLAGANLSASNLAWANLTGATLEAADLSNATLSSSRLHGANLSRANFTAATLAGADLLMANLKSSNLNVVYLSETIFADTDLTGATGLDTCRYSGPCTVDHRTLLNYEPLPLSFLRGCGLPEALITYLPSLAGQAFEFYSCFISHSSRDTEFAERIYADLQSRGVRCWFAPEDLRIGDKTWDAIDKAVRVHDKVVLVCSKSSIESQWVEDEVNKGFSEERRRKTTVLFPIRIDEAIMEAHEPWATKLRENRNIGDFTRWKSHDDYQGALTRMLRDLRCDDA